ncbi:Modification methylase DpnIIB [compost metagenome]
MTEVPVVAVNLDDDEERILNIGLNGIHGEWQRDRLAELLVELDARRAELLESDLPLMLTGFNDEAIAAVLEATGHAGPKEGLVPDNHFEPPTEVERLAPTTRPGDIIKLGEHLLICGDSTDPATIARLMQGQKAQCLITDPPYNVAYQADLTSEQAKASKRRTDGKVVANDAMSPEQFRAFLDAAFGAIAEHLEPGSPFYIYHADSETVAFRQAAIGAGLSVRQCLIWVKHYFALGRQDHQWRHEPCLYGWREGGPHFWYGGRDKSTVFEDAPPDFAKMKKEELVELLEQLTRELPSTVIHVDKPARSDLHPTMKPIELLEQHMINSTRAGDVVLDTFAGSGSTLITAEKHGRVARVVELDPAYCDAICRRYISWSGKPAYKLMADGSQVEWGSSNGAHEG